MTKLIGVLLLFVGVAGIAVAGPNGFSAPEIDPSSAISVLALLGSGLLMVRTRYKR